VKGRRAFLAALTRNTVEVVDLKAGRVIGHFRASREAAGRALRAEFNKLFVHWVGWRRKNAGGTTLEVLHTANVSLGATPSATTPGRVSLRRLRRGDADKESGDLTVFSAATGAQIAAIVTDAHAGAASRRARRQM